MVEINECHTELESTVKHGCSNNPVVLQWGEMILRETVASWSSLDIVHLNHLEYPVWPRQGLKDLFVCFCEHCREKVESQGIDFDKMKQEVGKFYQHLASPRNSSSQHLVYTATDILNLFTERPYLEIWINFRTDALTKFIKKMTEACRTAAKERLPNLKIGLEFFLPSVSKLFGTDYGELYTLYDWVAP